MALLDGLERIDWASLSHAHGPATDVPLLLRALANPERAPASMKAAAAAESLDVRQYVQDTLWDTLYQVGALFAASAPAVPFLVELLRAQTKAPELRRFLLEFLRSLAEGHPEDHFPTKIDPAHAFSAAELAANPQLAAQRDCYHAVERAVPAVLFFVDDADEQTALLAMALVAAFPSSAARAALKLRAISKSTKPDKAQRVCTALVTLATLLGEAAAADAARGLDSADPIVSFFAACASVIAAPHDVGPHAVVALLSLDDARARIPTPLCGTLAILAARCLVRLPADYRAQAIHGIAQLHAGADSVTRLGLSECLLAMTFGGRTVPAQASELELLQRYALETVVEHGGWKISGVEFGTYAELMELCGLPASRDALAAWLAG